MKLDFSKIIVALAPMDGYTDCAFREVASTHGNFDVVFTEFVNAQGLMRATKKLIDIFRYTENQRPIIAQLFGTDPEYFYQATILLCYLGFDGIDINMGCPAKVVASKGSGAGLIQTPELAIEIVEAVKRGVKAYREQRSDNSEQGAIDKKLSKSITIANEKIKEWGITVDSNRDISVSVKTRTGFDTHITEEWIERLSKTGIDFITLHGRTLKQMYTGKADWGEIKKAVAVSPIPIIGNGDVKNSNDIQRMLKQTGCQGVMIGRGALGKYWRFKDIQSRGSEPTDKGKEVQGQSLEPMVSLSQLKKMILEHAEHYVTFKGEQRFYELRKHLFHYIKEFSGARALRGKLVQVNSLKELKEILRDIEFGSKAPSTLKSFAGHESFEPAICFRSY